MAKSIAFFDFDGTITSVDSLVEFIQYAIGKKAYYKGLIKLSPILLAYFLKFIPNDKAKERLLCYFFSGWDTERFHTVADKYSLEMIDKITRSKAIARIKWHKQQGHKVVIVSASMESWLKSWCNKQEVTLISSHLEIKNGKITGKFASKNCYGPEKVHRIKALYTLSDFIDVYVYGDSLGDKEMLSLANKPYYKYFN
jgi:HAD superfamily hydrolase (TIGR01490 family)